MDRIFFVAETRLILVSYLFNPRSCFRDSPVLLNVEWRHFLAYILLRFASYSKLFLFFASATEIKMLFLDQSATVMLVVQTLVCLLTDF